MHEKLLNFNKTKKVKKFKIYKKNILCCYLYAQKQFKIMCKNKFKMFEISNVNGVQG